MYGTLPSLGANFLLQMQKYPKVKNLERDETVNTIDE
jgi:hypothetical protein